MASLVYVNITKQNIACEAQMNKKIKEAIPVTMREVTMEEAKKEGALLRQA